jgi:hypothetical protein
MITMAAEPSTAPTCPGANDVVRGVEALHAQRSSEVTPEAFSKLLGDRHFETTLVPFPAGTEESKVPCSGSIEMTDKPGSGCTFRARFDRIERSGKCTGVLEAFSHRSTLPLESAMALLVEVQTRLKAGGQSGRE